MDKYLKILIVPVIIVFALIGLNLYTAGLPTVNNIDPTLLTVAYLDVGQGDSILIRTPKEQNILIDGGPDDSVVFELDKIVPAYDRTIDAMILTHPHADHVDGLVDVLKDYQVDEIYYTGVSHTAPGYIEWLKTIKEKNIKMTIVKNPFALSFPDDIKLNFVFPLTDFTGQTVDNLNNTSIVSKLIYKNTSFLFAGDAEIEAEKEILASGADLSADVLKVGHHASRTATSDEFLQAIIPDYAVIQLGEGNSFGHPHYRTIKKLEDKGISILRNDEMGTVVMQSDGEKIYLLNDK